MTLLPFEQATSAIREDDQVVAVAEFTLNQKKNPQMIVSIKSL